MRGRRDWILPEFSGPITDTFSLLFTLLADIIMIGYVIRNRSLPAASLGFLFLFLCRCSPVCGGIQFHGISVTEGKGTWQE